MAIIKEKPHYHHQYNIKGSLQQNNLFVVLTVMRLYLQVMIL